MNYVLLVVGFILLIKGADIFVDNASAIARKIGIPSVIVGLTIVSLGTSAPELAISVISSLEGNNGITVGNVLGSNIFNSLVVLGGTALVMPIVFKKVTIKRDFIVNTLTAMLIFVLTFVLATNGEYILSRIDGIILLCLCIAYVCILIRAAKKQNIKDDNKDNEKINIVMKIVLVIVGVVGIIIGGNLVVDSATNIAYSLGMSEKLVGLTIVAIGTSLPELVTSVVAALKGEKEMALGNVLGSNIFNMLLILGASATISPIQVSGQLAIDFLFFIGITLLIGALIFFNKGEEKRFGRLEGTILILLYIAYTAYIIMRN